jgi:hypothetical protein
MQILDDCIIIANGILCQSRIFSFVGEVVLILNGDGITAVALAVQYGCLLLPTFPFLALLGLPLRKAG